MGNSYGGDMFGAAIGGTFGLINNAISYGQSKRSQARAYNYARLLQQHQYDLTQKGYREGPGNQRSGLESAGYNPMLALGNVGSATNVSGGTPVGANSTDSADLASSASMIQGMLNQNKQTDATVDNLDSATRKNNADAAGQETRNQYLDSREKAEIGLTEASTSKMNAEIRNMEAFQKFEQIRLQLQRLGIMKDYEASIYNSDSANSASRYATDKANEASRYSTDTGYLSGIYASDKAYNAATYRSWSDHYRNFGVGTGAILHGGASSYDRYDSYKERKNRRRVGF